MLRLKGKKQQSTPNLRSVGGKPCDFNRLKYTTSYRAFGRKSLPHIDRVQSVQNYQEPITLNIKLNDKQKEIEEKAVSRKKVNKIVDKWKQKYDQAYNVSEQNFLIKKKKHEVLPIINKVNPIHAPLVLLSTKSKFDIFQITQKKLKKKIKAKRQSIIDTDKMTEEQVEQIFRKYQSVPNMNSSKLSIYSNNNDEKIQSEPNLEQLSSYARRFKYSLQVQRKININLKKKSNTIVSNGPSLHLVEEIPERWEINGEQDNQVNQKQIVIPFLQQKQ